MDHESLAMEKFPWTRIIGHGPWRIPMDHGPWIYHLLKSEKPWFGHVVQIDQLFSCVLRIDHEFQVNPPDVTPPWAPLETVQNSVF